ncbi:MAG: hypothetical protein ACREA9_19195 [Pyrinomonadaceae bacterium]
MGKNLYGTVAALAWILEHYFYDRKHYSYFATEFYPYKLKNPRSSSPFMIYQDLYEPWRDHDDNSKIISMYRLALWGGVETKRRQGVIEDAVADRLKHICNKVNTMFFYPVVCRVNRDSLDQNRLEVSGSGVSGSSEFLVRDLDDAEIDELLFLDFDEDDDLKQLVREEYLSSLEGKFLIDSDEVLSILERRCDSNGLQLPFSAT